MDSPVNKSFQMGAWRVDPPRGEISQEGKVVRLQPRAMGILVCLAGRPGEVVSIDDLLTKAWPGVIVTPDSVYQSVGALREALGDDAKNPTYIATVPRMGYRLVAPVTPVVESTAASAAPSILAPGTKHVAPVAAATARSNHASTYAIALILLCSLGFGVYRLTERRSAPATTASATSMGASNEPSIAVLPFLDMSEGRDQQYFADGMTEELIDLLSQFPALKVSARTSSFYFQNKPTPVSDIAKMLGVTNVLEGSVRKSSGKMRITAQLIRTDTGFHVWSETYEEPLDDIFKVQDDIARKIGEKLQTSLADDLASKYREPRGTTNPDAYTFYVKGLALYRHAGVKADYEDAANQLRQSVTIDPAFAEGWLNLEMVLSGEVIGGFVTPEVVSAEMRHAADRVVALMPNTAPAHRAIAQIDWSLDWKWRAAAEEYKRAYELDPNSAQGVRQLASVSHLIVGDDSTALNLYRRAIDLDPLRDLNHIQIGIYYLDKGQLSEAESAMQAALALNAKLPSANAMMGQILIARGRPTDALATVQREPADADRRWGLALAYQALGRKADADAALAAMERWDAEMNAFLIAEIYAYRGELDQAFAWLERAQRQRDMGLMALKTDPIMNNLRGDPRYKALLVKMNLLD
jgi:TolB-like protein/DNA-binding winged helix-turn-helix (wHTH) protein/thioredoxin-like negative regulator of GroEL